MTRGSKAHRTLDYEVVRCIELDGQIHLRRMRDKKRKRKPKGACESTIVKESIIDLSDIGPFLHIFFLSIFKSYC